MCHFKLTCSSCFRGICAPDVHLASQGTVPQPPIGYRSNPFRWSLTSGTVTYLLYSAKPCRSVNSSPFLVCWHSVLLYLGRVSVSRYSTHKRLHPFLNFYPTLPVCYGFDLYPSYCSYSSELHDFFPPRKRHEICSLHICVLRIRPTLSCLCFYLLSSLVAEVAIMQPNYAGSQNAHLNPGLAAPGPYSTASSASLNSNLESDSDPSAPASNHRDSVGSIIDDPFFQTYDPAIQAANASEDDQSDGSSVYQSLDDEDHEHLFHDTKGNNFGKPPRPSRRKSRGEARKPDPDSDDNEANQHWPPPRRESLTAAPSSYWVCNKHHFITCRLAPIYLSRGSVAQRLGEV